MIKLTQDVEEALDRFALEQDITREEALAVIARDWLIGLGYLAGEDDENDREHYEKEPIKKVRRSMEHRTRFMI